MSLSRTVVLVVTSNGAAGESGRATGVWAEEFLEPFGALTKAGLDVLVASPKGGQPPFDPVSLNARSAAALAEPSVSHALDSVPLAEVDNDHDAYFVVGGYGVMWDLHSDVMLHRLLAAGWENGAVVGGVCHGPSALAGVELSDGTPLVSGRRVTAFSSAEDDATGMSAILPYSPELELRRAGALYEAGPGLWPVHVAVDGRLVTGQNPPSARAVATALVELVHAM